MSQDAYLGKICRKVFSSHSPFRAQVLNQEQSLPTSLPYTQTPTSQSNLNVPESSGLPAQVPVTVSAAQNLKIQMSEEGVHSNKLPGHPQREIQQLESENLISQLMNGQDTQKNHPQNKGEEQEQTTPRVSTSQQNNMASFNVHGPSLLGTQSQEVEQSQPLMLQHLYDVDDWREETYQKVSAS